MNTATPSQAHAHAHAAPVLHVAEPPAAYLIHPPLVVDCSTLAALLFQEPMRDEAVVHLTARSLHAPHLLDHEMASVAAKKLKAGWPADSVELALQDYVAQALSLHTTDVQAQYALAQRFGLSTYDAAYLWLAGELKCPLATFDHKLAKAAVQYLSELP